ncbi:MAG: hypothetical protein M1140_15670 [Chloroflexi bacterium]|nr:hypothetical protein [Chloroflexota bacterium]
MSIQSGTARMLYCDLPFHHCAPWSHPSTAGGHADAGFTLITWPPFAQDARRQKSV